MSATKTLIDNLLGKISSPAGSGWISIAHQKSTSLSSSTTARVGGYKRLHASLPCFPGVGIGVVHAGYERRLAHHLGAHSTPSILGIINGKISFFHNAVVRENLRQFVESLLPGNLVEKVSTPRRRNLRGTGTPGCPELLSAVLSGLSVVSNRARHILIN